MWKSNTNLGLVKWEKFDHINWLITVSIIPLKVVPIVNEQAKTSRLSFRWFPGKLIWHFWSWKQKLSISEISNYKPTHMFNWNRTHADGKIIKILILIKIFLFPFFFLSHLDKLCGQLWYIDTPRSITSLERKKIVFFLYFLGGPIFFESIFFDNLIVKSCRRLASIFTKPCFHGTSYFLRY